MALLLAGKRGMELRLRMEILESLVCPECGSSRIVKDGLRYLNDGSQVQRFLCQNPECGERFSDPNRRVLYRNLPCEAIADNGLSGIREYANQSVDSKNSLSLVSCMTEQKSEQTTREKLQQVIGTHDIIGKILNYQLYLERKGRKPLTVSQAIRRLTMHVEKGVDLLDPEQVKEFLARQTQWSNRTKILEVSIYDGFLKFLKIPWEKPEYRPERKPIFMPNEEELDQLIAGSGRKMVPFLRILKETAMRFAECHQLQWTDINFQRKQITIQTEKGSDPRIIPISQALINMLSNMPRKSERLFPATRGAISSNYYLQRKKIAQKLGIPRIMKISLHTFRHWRITNYAHEVGGNYALVQEFSGHRDIESVAIYIHLRKQIYLNGREDDYIVEIARTVEEASKLIAVGFEFVHEYNGVMIYRRHR